MNHSLFNALLLGDGRVPTGGYSDSAGLEPAVMTGLKLDEVQAYMQARLQTITKMEAAASVLAHRLAIKKADKKAFEELEAAVQARTPSSAQRKTSRFMGRGLLYLGQNIQPDNEGLKTLNTLQNPPSRGVALGVFAAALDVNESHCAEACCYDDMQRITEATLKLLPTDPALVTAWLIKIGKNVPEIIEEVIKIKKPVDLPAVGAPWMEHWAEKHSKQSRRLFMA